MTSKEYVKGVLYNLEETLKLARETNNKDLEIDCKMQIEEYKKVLKDLEVLEILKQLAKGVIELKNNNIDITKYVVLISESTNEKIKRWLDGKD